jgi:hypothetical protein
VRVDVSGADPRDSVRGQGRAVTPVELPELLQAELDDGEVLRLLGDVLTKTTLLGATEKGGATRFVEAEPLADAEHEARARLEALATTLRSGSGEKPHGLQLRYVFDGVVFYDTLLRRGACWRLTRIAPPHDQTSRP